MPSLDLTSTLAASAARVWSHASTFAGVNEELWPVHMSGGDNLRLDARTRTGELLFRSVLTLVRVLPLDVHSFALEEVWPGRGFHERSHSWLQRRWIHVRTIEPLSDTSCVVRDRLDFAPRVWPSLTAWIVRCVFLRRHRRLQAKFGGTR